MKKNLFNVFSSENFSPPYTIDSENITNDLIIIFDKYKKNILESIEDFYKNRPEEINAVKNFQYIPIKTLCNTIILAIEEYYKGSPFKAYNEFKRGLIATETFSQLLKEKIPERKSFYRIRNDESRKTLNGKELLHIPFNLRKKVSTQRFSIPGSSPKVGG